MYFLTGTYPATLIGRNTIRSSEAELTTLITTGRTFIMKGRDIALFVSIQGILLGAAFVLSSGQDGLQDRTTQLTKPAQIQRGTLTTPVPTQPIARQMTMQVLDSFQQVGRDSSSADHQGLPSHQRRWVF
jgi:hypothetical protein